MGKTSKLLELLSKITESARTYDTEWKNPRAKFAPGDKVILHPFIYTQDKNKEMPKSLAGKEHHAATVIAKSNDSQSKYGYVTRYHIKYDDGKEAKIHSVHLLPAHMSQGIKAAHAHGFEYSHRSGNGTSAKADIVYRHPEGTQMTIHYNPHKGKK